MRPVDETAGREHSAKAQRLPGPPMGPQCPEAEGESEAEGRGTELEGQAVKCATSWGSRERSQVHYERELGERSDLFWEALPTPPKQAAMWRGRLDGQEVGAGEAAWGLHPPRGSRKVGHSRSRLSARGRGPVHWHTHSGPQRKAYRTRSARLSPPQSKRSPHPQLGELWLQFRQRPPGGTRTSKML